MLQSQTIGFSGRKPGPGRRWLGTLYCRTPGCAQELAEVFADSANRTYLPQIGGSPVREIGIECPNCHRTRLFRSVTVAPAGALPPAAESRYDPPIGTT